MPLYSNGSRHTGASTGPRGTTATIWRSKARWATVGLLGTSVLGLLVGCSTGSPARSFGSSTPTAATTSTDYPSAVSSGLTRPADAKGPYTLTRVQAKLNNRPRKTLGWKTPAEAFGLAT
jgi:hypothetical protein